MNRLLLFLQFLDPSRMKISPEVFIDLTLSPQAQKPAKNQQEKSTPIDVEETNKRVKVEKQLAISPPMYTKYSIKDTVNKGMLF